MNAPLQAVAVSFNEGGLKSLCSVYFPPNDQILDQQIKKLIDQLPKPTMIVGDMNALNLMSDGYLDARGMTIQSIIETKNLAVLNEDQPTFYRILTLSWKITRVLGTYTQTARNLMKLWDMD